MLDVPAHREDALPPGDWVGAHYRVDSLELGADILGGPTGLIVELEPGLLGDFAEPWLFKGCGEGFEELLVRLADSVVDLVARGPEGVCCFFKPRTTWLARWRYNWLAWE